MTYEHLDLGSYSFYQNQSSDYFEHFMLFPIGP